MPRPPRFDTAQLSLVRTPFDDPDFLFEVKHDGFRALAPETSAYLKQHGAVCAKKPNH
jgi:ATP-dependent DNA ligase